MDQFTQPDLTELGHHAAKIRMNCQRLEPVEFLGHQALADVRNLFLDLPVPNRLEILERGLGEFDGCIDHAATSLGARGLHSSTGFGPTQDRSSRRPQLS